MASLEHELEQGTATAPERRSFLKGALAVLIGGLALLAAPWTGARVFLQPMRRKTRPGTWVRVATLSALPADGVPRRFPVVSDQVNAWTTLPQVPVGAVFLRRSGEQSVEALSVVCPHAGCLVDYRSASGGYFCPCHNSTFALDGKVNDTRSPSPRGLDGLSVEIRGQGEVWVRWETFRTGTEQKLPT
jgi:menaquinol-cytochrome c reductase iron-sulfur subunit